MQNRVAVFRYVKTGRWGKRMTRKGVPVCVVYMNGLSAVGVVA
jgi:hypothetical protein